MAIAATAAKPSEPAPVKAIQADRIINLAHATGEPRQIVLPNDVPPKDFLENVGYWQHIATTHIPVGAKFELTNDAGSFLWECWVRMIHGSPNTGIRAIRVHRREVWDDGAGAIDSPIQSTGRWEYRWGGSHHRWRVYTPKGNPIGTMFNSESEALAYCQRQEMNPRPL